MQLYHTDMIYIWNQKHIPEIVILNLKIIYILVNEALILLTSKDMHLYKWKFSELLQ